MVNLRKTDFIFFNPPTRYKNSFWKLHEKQLQAKQEEDLRLGRTTYGPHTDTINILINKKSIKNHASQGEKSLCFSILKKAEANIIQKKTNKEPIILLDDILSGVLTFILMLTLALNGLI